MEIRDILLDKDGDFEVSETGDLKIVEGEKAINESLYRRIKTPAAGYARWVRYEDGLAMLDKEYGNPLYSYLSSPITNTTIGSIKEAITTAVEGEKRIKLIKLSIEPKAEQSKIDVLIDYIIKGENIIRTLNYTLTNKV
jgi:phage baseplate assembly protein W